MAMGKNSAKLVAIVSKDLEQEVKELARQEKRTDSKMIGILIEIGLEAFKNERKE